MPANAQLLAPKPGRKPRTAFLGKLGEIISISECCRLKAPLRSASHFKQDEVKASSAAKPLPGILREQDRPAEIHDNAGFCELNHKSTDFALFSDRSRFTDDTVLTVAVPTSSCTERITRRRWWSTFLAIQTQATEGRSLSRR